MAVEFSLTSSEEFGIDPWVEMMWTPTEEEIEAEESYWSSEDMRSEVAEHEAQVAEAQWDFESWPLADLEEELETVKALTPNMTDIIAEIEHVVAQRKWRGA